MVSEMPQDCFADEIAIDFPSVVTVVERMRARFLGEDAGSGDRALVAEISLSTTEARTGVVLPLELPVRTTCAQCGGRGESWTERCSCCSGTGESISRQAVNVTVPRGIADGACLRFRVRIPGAPSVRVELRIAIRS